MLIIPGTERHLIANCNSFTSNTIELTWKLHETNKWKQEMFKECNWTGLPVGRNWHA